MSTISLSNSAFEGCTSLTTFTFADNIGSLGTDVFKDCSNLESVFVNDKVRSLPNNTFLNCANLSVIQLYKTMDVIALSAFQGCTKLKTYAAAPPYDGTLHTDAVPGDYVYDYFLPPGTNDFYVNLEEPICYNEGTKILCLTKELKEEYIAIEKLRSGDYVKTYKHGYRKITAIGNGTMINNPLKYSACMYRMRIEKSEDLFEDLIVTGGHSILVDSLGESEETNLQYLDGTNPKIDDKFLLASAAASNIFEKIEESKEFTYYHFVLANDGCMDRRFGVWANGILSETPSMNQFLLANLKPL